MRNYNVKLESKVDKKDYYINRVASSVDLHLDKKLTHEISIDCDFETDYNVGLIIGNSGSGKTTFAEIKCQIRNTDTRNPEEIKEELIGKLKFLL